MIEIITQTTYNFRSIVSTTATIYTQFTFTRRASPWEVRIVTQLFEFILTELGAIRVVPEGTLITTNAIKVGAKILITLFTIFFPAMVTSPGFVGVFSMQFNFIIGEICAFPMIIFFTFFTRNGVFLTSYTGTCLTFTLSNCQAVSKP